MSARFGSATITTPSDREILITRRFDAPAALVFEVWTTPEHVRRWWGFEDMEMLECEIDLRVGGSWRYVVQGRDGEPMSWSGTYREVSPPHRLVSTETFQDQPSTTTTNTLTIREVDGVPTLEILVRHQTEAQRDGQLASGMETGLQHGLDRFERLVTGGHHHTGGVPT